MRNPFRRRPAVKKHVPPAPRPDICRGLAHHAWDEKKFMWRGLLTDFCRVCWVVRVNGHDAEYWIPPWGEAYPNRMIKEIYGYG